MGGAAKALHERGNKVVVLADGHRGRLEESESFGAVRYFGGWKPFRRWRKAQALRHILAKESVKAILADSWKSVETLVRSGASTEGVAVVCFAHGNEFPPEPNSSKAERIAIALACVDKVIAVSQFTADRVRRYLHSDAIVVRPPPIEQLVASSAEDRAWAEALWQSDGPKLLSLARLEPLKGIDHTILALSRIVKEYPHIRYVVAGPGEDLPRLQSLMSENNLQRHVIFAGPVIEGRKTALYETADLFVMPTRRVGEREEGFGMVYLEAAQCGLPVIGGLSGGAKDVFRGENACMLVDGEDITAVADAVSLLLQNEKLRIDMGRTARRVAADALWPRQVAALELELGISSGG